MSTLSNHPGGGREANARAPRRPRRRHPSELAHQSRKSSRRLSRPVAFWTARRIVQAGNFAEAHRENENEVVSSERRCVAQAQEDEEEAMGGPELRNSKAVTPSHTSRRCRSQGVSVHGPRSGSHERQQLFVSAVAHSVLARRPGLSPSLSHRPPPASRDHSDWHH